MLRISFALVLTSLALLLTLLPAILIWVMFSQLLDSSFSELQGATGDSVDAMARNVQDLLMQQAMQVVDVRLTEGQNALVSLRAFVNTTPFPTTDLRPSRTDLMNEVLLPYRSLNFIALKGNDFFSSITFQGVMFPNGPDQPGTRLFWNTWSSFNMNPVTQTTGQRTFFLSEMQLYADEQVLNMVTYYVDQDTAKPLLVIQNQNYSALALNYPNMPPSGWDNDLGFSPFTGLVQLGGWYWVACANATWVQVSISVTAYTFSQELLARLDGFPDDRLYILFRQPHGHMLAASHGKYWSQSDIDRSQVDPLTNPPDASKFQLWTCLNATDLLINSSCAQLYAQYQSWVDIPELRVQMVLNNTPYWVAVAHDDLAINCTVVMLKNRAAVMGVVDASQAAVNESVDRRKVGTYVIIGVITFFGALLPLLLGLWLGHRLLTLSAEMDKIARLQFDSIDTPPTVFSELHRFQASFSKMERGLRAFSQFVPQAVVKVLITGRMQAGQHMANERVTVMFADIEGFSGICETLHPQQVADVCTEYFEVMCGEVVDSNGTIDKFIGDCIMAIWNAPTPVPQHEVAAVRAALAMQDRILALHGPWRLRRLPLLKFRLGLHTGAALVGNFGCSYRISYTCLGDSVNIAARLEALNKKFGTFLCISEPVYDACKGQFECRRLSKVTLPGKVEVLPVYEVLCRASGADLYGTEEELHSSVTIGMEPDLRKSKLPAQIYHMKPASTMDSDDVVYHWDFVRRDRLLRHSSNYEAAYMAMVMGDLNKAKKLLLADKVIPAPDKAWDALEEQLQQIGPSKPWDGVFYFREK